MGHYIENLPECFVSEEMVETTAVCHVLLPGQKNPVKKVNQNG